MIQKINNYLKVVLIAALLSPFIVSCKDDNPDNGGNSITDEYIVIIPENVDLIMGGGYNYLTTRRLHNNL